MTPKCYHLRMKTFYYRHNLYGEKPHEIAHSKINFSEITFVIKGRLDYEINGQVVTIKENDCIYLSPGNYRSRHPLSQCDYASFNFDGDASSLLPMHIPDCLNSEIKLLINLCDVFMNKHFDWSNKIDSVLELIIKLLNDKLSVSEENPIIIKIKRYVAENLQKKLSLSEICFNVGYSPNYCDTLFKKLTGTSIINHLINERIEKAKLLIAENILTLKEIGEAVGFDDYNYFSRIFKKRLGCSPKEYKTNVITNLYKN